MEVLRPHLVSISCNPLYPKAERRRPFLLLQQVWTVSHDRTKLAVLSSTHRHTQFVKQSGPYLLATGRRKRGERRSGYRRIRPRRRNLSDCERRPPKNARGRWMRKGVPTLSKDGHQGRTMVPACSDANSVQLVKLLWSSSDFCSIGHMVLRFMLT